MRALITGGAGFVGRRFCRVLLEEGWKEVCVDPVVPRTGGLDPKYWPDWTPHDYPSFTF
jgi:GDP-L-fucose synthase